MVLTWGYVWGIWWWRSTGQSMDTDRLRTPLHKVPSPESLCDAISKEEAMTLHDKGVSCGIPQSIPMDVVVTGTRPRIQNRCFVVHQWNGFVPAGSLCNTGSNNYVCSPEFCLVQIARYIRRLITACIQPWQYTVIFAELACELCGTYSKQNTPVGFKERYKPLTSVGALMVFCGRMAFEPGANMVRKALAWTLDGLNSPMETVLYLLLCLPRSYGGLEIPRPFSNFRLEVPQELWPKTHLRHVVPDLYWPETSLIVEHNGKDSHDGHGIEDQERVEIAQDMGHKVITFRKEDLFDKRRFAAKAQSVARALGRELPEATEQFNDLQSTLLNMLLRHERWI